MLCASRADMQEVQCRVEGPFVRSVGPRSACRRRGGRRPERPDQVFQGERPVMAHITSPWPRRTVRAQAAGPNAHRHPRGAPPVGVPTAKARTGAAVEVLVEVELAAGGFRPSSLAGWQNNKGEGACAGKGHRLLWPVQLRFGSVTRRPPRHHPARTESHSRGPSRLKCTCGPGRAPGARYSTRRAAKGRPPRGQPLWVDLRQPPVCIVHEV